MAWVDDNGRLHVGDLATGRQQLAARISATHSAAGIGGRAALLGGHRRGYLPGYGQWPDVVRSLNLATGEIRSIAPGQAVFASADGRHVFIAWTGTDVIEVPADGPGPARQLDRAARLARGRERRNRRGGPGDLGRGL